MGRAKQAMLEDDGFSDFLQEILELGGLEGKELGIAKQVMDKGRESLSEKQDYVFQKNVLDHYVTKECARCSSPIPWSEMMAASENGGFCSWCDHQLHKVD